MYTVIYSTDPYLLARMATDLQMGGWEYDNFNDPFIRNRIVVNDGNFYFIDHEGVDNPIRHTLTSRNYLKVLGAILNSKK